MSSQIGITIPAGFTNGNCYGCIGIPGNYILSRATFTHFPCGGDPTVVVGIADRGYLHQDANQCSIGGMYVNLYLFAWLAVVGPDHYWRTVLRLAGISGLASVCQDWVYESTRMPAAVVDVIGPVTLNYVSGTGCHGETSGGPFACNLCNNPPDRITLAVA